MSQLTLKCEKFGLSRGLHDLFTSGDLADVTLACQGQFIQAHKTVLAACSPHFRDIFKLQVWQHPIVFMHDAEVRMLSALVDFMYNGEVTVNEADLPGFLKLADALQVSGLTHEAKEAQSRVADMAQTHLSPAPPTPPPAKIARRMQDVDVSRHKLAPPTSVQSEPTSWEAVPIEDISMLTSDIKLEVEELPQLTDPISISEQDCDAIAEEEEEDEEDDSHIDAESLQDDSWYEAGPSTSNHSSSQPSTSTEPASHNVSSRGNTASKSQINEDGSVYCIPCNKNIKNEQLWKRHSRTNIHEINTQNSKSDCHQVQPLLICVHCSKTFRQQTALNYHVKISHLFFCVKCNTQFESEAKLRQHNIDYHYNSVNLYTCKLCKLEFPRSTALKEHLSGVHNLSSVLGNDAFRCEYCLEIFGSKSVKLEHIRKDHPETRFVCRVCPKDLNSKGERLTHEINVHRVNVDHPEQFYVCEVCDKPFASEKHWTRHKSVHL